MSECKQCGDTWPREKMLGLDLFEMAAAVVDEREFERDDEDVVCLRCASVAMKGGPSNMSKEEREAHNVVLE